MTKKANRKTSKKNTPAGYGGETRILTRDGRCTLAYLDGKEVEALTAKGVWSPVNIRSIGNADLLPMFVRHSERHSDDWVWVTEGNFFLSMAEIDRVASLVPVRDLEKGNILIQAFASRFPGHPLSPAAITAGAVNAIGEMRYKPDGNKRLDLTIDPESHRCLVPYLEKTLGHKLWKNKRSKQLEALDIPQGLYPLPLASKSKEYLFSWLAGFYAASCAPSPFHQQSNLWSLRGEAVVAMKNFFDVIGVETYPYISYGRSAIFGGFTLPFKTDRLPLTFFLSESRRKAAEYDAQSERPSFVRFVKAGSVQLRVEAYGIFSKQPSTVVLENNLVSETTVSASKRVVKK